MRGFLAQKLARDLAGNPSQLIAVPSITITCITPNLKEGGLFADITTGILKMTSCYELTRGRSPS